MSKFETGSYAYMVDESAIIRGEGFVTKDIVTGFSYEINLPFFEDEVGDYFPMQPVYTTEEEALSAALIRAQEIIDKHKIEIDKITKLLESRK